MTSVISWQRTTSPALVYLAGLGESSRVGQHYALRVLVGLLGGCNPATYPWENLDALQIGVVRGQLAAAYAPGTANKILSALAGVLKAAWLDGQISHERHERLKESIKVVPGNAIRQGRMLSMEEIEKLVKAASSARDRAIIAVLFEAGLRRAELCALDLSDYANGMLQVRKSKNGKTRQVPVMAARARLDAWVGERGQAPGALFLTQSGGRMSYNAIPMLLKRLSIKASVAPWSTHDGRRTYISALLASGSDLAVAAALAGHSSPSTTVRYDRRPLTARIEAVARLRMPV